MIGNCFAVGMLQCAICLCPLQQLIAQDARQLSDSPAFTQSTPSASDTILIHGFTQVPLRLEQPISSASARKGDHVRLTLLKNLSNNGTLAASAGLDFDATVSHVRQKSRHHSGEIELSDAVHDLQNGQQLRLSKNDSQDNLAFDLYAAVMLGPITVAILPIQLPYLLIHDISNHHHANKNPSPKPKFLDKDFSAGAIFVYYADQKSLMRKTPAP